MASEKPRTQRQLVEDTAAQVEQISDAVSDMHSALKVWEGQKRAPSYGEADALAECIAALTKLTDAERQDSLAWPSGTSMSVNAAYTDHFLASWGPGERILRFLADRFGINLIEVHDQPCQRRHVDEVSADELLAALRTAR